MYRLLMLIECSLLLTLYKALLSWEVIFIYKSYKAT